MKYAEVYWDLIPVVAVIPHINVFGTASHFDLLQYIKACEYKDWYNDWSAPSFTTMKARWEGTLRGCFRFGVLAERTPKE